MSEWLSVLAVFWVLWVVDGIRLAPTALFALIGGRRSATFSFRRWHRPSWLPTGWRATVTDIPFALSPVGICNRPVASAGRPGEAPTIARAWPWGEIREATVNDGWVLINGTRFCRDTGHLRMSQLLALAKMDEAARTKQIDWQVRQWLRPAHLRRRAKVLRGHTATPAMLNSVFGVIAALMTIYLAGNFAERLSGRWSAALASLLPLLLGYLLLLHAGAVFMAWRTSRRLKATGPDKRGLNLLSAALLPPQALRLRALVGEGFFPPQHPLAYAVAFARKDELQGMAFHVLGDLRWPVGEAMDSPLSKEIAGWFRRALGERIRPMLQAAGLDESTLFVAPVANSADSASYCPRCRSQFIGGPKVCPKGIELQPVVRR